MVDPRDVHAWAALNNTQALIKKSRVLLVGAGGIGCELLKNLVLSGFGEVVIVDLDTIDLSNLNRQFLFNMQHIKKSKAMVAKETAQAFNPNVKITAFHENIKADQFDVTFFKGFNIVFNALDNLDARRHVNKMCLHADVPLIESGTTGFNGQVQVIKKGKTECYDCTPKPVVKSFPVCTIRSTPSQPIHCIVWAKSYLFTEIFGTSEESSPELDNSESSENAAEIESLRKEAAELKKIRELIGTDEFAKTIFEKVFTRDIERLLGMEDMWKSRKPPTPLNFDKVDEAAKSVPSDIASKDQKVWNLAENYAVFVDSLQRLSKRAVELHANAMSDGATPILSFDKDDVDTLDFVAAAANMRSAVFCIEAKSKFDIKQMAGNIIPAIATTNAIIAGVCVLQAYKVLNNDLDNARMVFLSRSSERIFSNDKLSAPNPDCGICGVERLTFSVDLSKATLHDIVDFLKNLGYTEDFSIVTTELIYDPDFDDNLESMLSALNIKNGSFITIHDEGDENDTDEGLKVDVVIQIVKGAVTSSDTAVINPTPALPEGYKIPHKPKKVKPATNGEAGETVEVAVAGTKRNLENEDGAEKTSPRGEKRRKVEEDVAELSLKEKKAKTASGQDGDGGIVIIEDSGVIEID